MYIPEKNGLLFRSKGMLNGEAKPVRSEEVDVFEYA